MQTRRLFGQAQGTGIDGQLRGILLLNYIYYIVAMVQIESLSGGIFFRLNIYFLFIFIKEYSAWNFRGGLLTTFIGVYVH